MTSENKKIEFNATKWADRPLFKHLFPVVRKIAILMLPLYSIIGISYLGFFSKSIHELIIQLSALTFLVLGLPLSAGLRVDQLSLELGGSFSREVILILASLVTWINLFLIFGFRAWLKTPNNKD